MPHPQGSFFLKNTNQTKKTQGIFVRNCDCCLQAGFLASSPSLLAAGFCSFPWPRGGAHSSGVGEWGEISRPSSFQVPSSGRSLPTPRRLRLSLSLSPAPGRYYSRRAPCCKNQQAKPLLGQRFKRQPQQHPATTPARPVEARSTFCLLDFPAVFTRRTCLQHDGANQVSAPPPSPRVNRCGGGSPARGGWSRRIDILVVCVFPWKAPTTTTATPPLVPSHHPTRSQLFISLREFCAGPRHHMLPVWKSRPQGGGKGRVWGGGRNQSAYIQAAGTARRRLQREEKLVRCGGGVCLRACVGWGWGRYH